MLLVENKTDSFYFYFPTIFRLSVKRQRRINTKDDACQFFWEKAARMQLPQYKET